MDILISSIVGIMIGHLYGHAFMLEKKQVHPSVEKTALTRRLSIISIARYLLLAAVLYVLFSLSIVHPLIVLGGMLVGFWIVIVKQTKKRHENRII